MGARAAMAEIGRRATAFGQRWFPERQVIIRQQETVRAIRLASGAQMLAASLLLVGGACTLAASGAYLIAGSRVRPVETVATLAKPTSADDTTLPQPVVATAEVAASAPDPAAGPVLASVAPLATEAPAAVVATPEDQGRQPPQDAAAAQDRAKELERTLAATRQLLDQAQAARQAALHERDAMAARLSDTEKRMHAASAEQEQALTRLTQETRRSIGEVERIINAVGIDPARLIPQNSPDGHRGGPFVPWDAQQRAQKAPSSRLPEGYGSDIARLDLLLQLLRTMPLAAPVQEFVLTSPFGYRKDPFNGEAALHEGIDLQAPRGTPITATAPGRVTFAGRQSSYGLMVEIEHSNDIHTRYAHLDRIAVKPGEKVGFRQVIGLLGSTGRASGPHVHYEVLVDGRPHDPLNFLKAASNVRKNH